MRFKLRITTLKSWRRIFCLKSTAHTKIGPNPTICAQIWGRHGARVTHLFSYTYEGFAKPVTGLLAVHGIHRTGSGHACCISSNYATARASIPSKSGRVECFITSGQFENQIIEWGIIRVPPLADWSKDALARDFECRHLQSKKDNET
jgi:hypothetical protein